MRRGNVKEIQTTIKSYGAMRALMCGDEEIQVWLGSYPSPREARAAARAGRIMIEHLRKHGILPPVKRNGRPKKKAVQPLVSTVEPLKQAEIG